MQFEELVCSGKEYSAKLKAPNHLVATGLLTKRPIYSQKGQFKHEKEWSVCNNRNPIVIVVATVVTNGATGGANGATVVTNGATTEAGGATAVPIGATTGARVVTTRARVATTGARVAATGAGVATVVAKVHTTGTKRGTSATHLCWAAKKP